ncbi:MAG: Ig-like domain-containing protein [Bacteroidales bacterium]|nr:Ig-like domain-containing protein [Bacteroidales bacterium]
MTKITHSKNHIFLICNLLAAVTVAVFFCHCAQITSPSGGKKDETPPRALKYSPQNEAVNFSARTITITFDEFFVLENASEQILISPMLKPKPNFRVKGKSLVIDLKECELQENTTYSFFFGEAIKDLHERNILHDFYYVFSTGDYVDSLYINGFVHNAFDLKTQEKVFVMLYSCTNDTIPCDSLPYLVQPEYIALTREDGSFALRNLSDRSYRMFALKDQNRNFLYDMGEEIAFLDSLITPGAISCCNHHHDDDSLQIHSAAPRYVELFMFTEMDSTVRILKNEVLDSVRITLCFSRPTTDITFSVLSPSTANLPDSMPWNITAWSKEKDTATLWFPYFINDSISLIVSHEDVALDTLIFSMKKTVAPQSGRRKQTVVEAVEPVLGITNNVAGRLPFFAALELKFDAPVYSWNMDRVLFYVDNDTVGVSPPPFRASDDFFQRRTFDYKFKEKTSYKMLIPSGTFTDILGRSNDTTMISFTTDDPEIYGALTLELTVPDNTPPLLLQLLTEKELILQQHTVLNSGKIDFGYLKPGKFLLKVIYDANQNNKWDTGHYLMQILPESVRYFDKVVEIRANWDIEEEWELPND